MAKALSEYVCTFVLPLRVIILTVRNTMFGGSVSRKALISKTFLGFYRYFLADTDSQIEVVDKQLNIMIET